MTLRQYLIHTWPNPVRRSSSHKAHLSRFMGLSRPVGAITWSKKTRARYNRYLTSARLSYLGGGVDILQQCSGRHRRQRQTSLVNLQPTDEAHRGDIRKPVDDLKVGVRRPPLAQSCWCRVHSPGECRVHRPRE